MKKFAPLFIVFIFFAACSSTKQPASVEAVGGAWEFKQAGITHTALVADGYLMVTKYDEPNKKFIESFGGPFTLANEVLTLTTQFHTTDKTQVGKTKNFEFELESGGKLENDFSGKEEDWNKLGDNSNALSANWRITQILRDGKMEPLELRARRTLKLLAGGHFQWAAINIETGEFSGTGGGRYDFTQGSYTEHIRFFSRDSSRVGMSLNFTDSLQNGEWIHSGKSSKGDPLREVWSRFKE